MTDTPSSSLHFFDDWRLRLREGFDREQGSPEPLREIPLGTRPELKILRGLVGTRYDERRECWFSIVDCHPADGSPRFALRMETDDPCHWEAPRWSEGGDPIWRRTDSLMVDQYDEPIACFNILPLAGTPHEERGYFMNMYRYIAADGTRTPGAVAFSQDGFRFEVDVNTRWIDYLSDTGNPTIYDPVIGQYRIYCRPHFVDRRAAMLLSPDLNSFGEPTVILQPDALDPPNREFYGIEPIPLDDMYVAHLAVYDTEPSEIESPGKMQGTTQTELAYSYNGQNWYRARREPFLARTGAGSFFGGSVYPSAPMRTADDRLLFHCMGQGVKHGAHDEEIPEERRTEATAWKTFQYEMRLDGWNYLRTRARYGRIQTKALIPAGGRLIANVRTAPTGEARAALLDYRTLEPLPHYTLDECVPINGDAVAGVVRWQEREDLEELKGRPVILEVKVREGELYSLRFDYRMAEFTYTAEGPALLEK